VLADEPTAALGVAQTKQVLALIRRLREQGLAVVVISHNLADVLSGGPCGCDAPGTVVRDFQYQKYHPEQIIAAITVPVRPPDEC